MDNIIKGYLVDADSTSEEFRLVKDDYTTIVTPDSYHRYQDRDTGRMYMWAEQKYRDHSFYQEHQYDVFEDGDRIQTNRIYLAKPGHRLLGAITGIDEDSCSLTTNLNNVDQLSFTVYRVIDGEVTRFYDEIARPYELYIPDYGWFKINEEPEIEYDGVVESKQVIAESLDIELQQYDLVDFYINTGEVNSKEQLATDNTYDKYGYNMIRDQVLFYRDTTDIENAIEALKETGGTVEDLKTYAESHPEIVYKKDDKTSVSTGCWRITRNEDTKEIEIDAKHYSTSDEIEQGIEYPDYTGAEILDLELQREHELSFLWLVLHEHGWGIGFVDPSYDKDSDNELDRTPLANRVAYIETQTQDIYSFLTQTAAQQYRCVFLFDTENYLVNSYSLDSIGFNTNVFLSFRNIQNQITRSSDRDLYTVFHVQGEDDLRIDEVNYGEDYISDISYFLNENHFTKDFITKYNKWIDYRNSRRLEYKDASVTYRELYQTAQEIYDRVPVDNVEGKQYSTMKMEELLEEKERMIAAKEGLEGLYVNDNGDFDINAIRSSDDWSWYDSLINFILSDPYSVTDPNNPTEKIEAVDYVYLKEVTDPETSKTTIEQDFDYEAYKEDTTGTTATESYTDTTIKDGVTYYKITKISSRANVESVVKTADDTPVEWYVERDGNAYWLWTAFDKITYTIDYAVESYRLGQIDIAIFNRRVIDGYYTEQEKKSYTYLDTTIKDEVLYYKICDLEDDEEIKENSVESLSDGSAVDYYEINTEDDHSFWAADYYIKYVITYDGNGKRMRTNPKNQMDYLDDYAFDFDTYGYMYGVAELEAQLKAIMNNLNTLETNGYDEDGDTTEYGKQAYAKYLRYLRAKETCELALAERREEYNAALADVDTVDKRRQTIAEAVSITNEQFHFTDEELALLDKYYIHTDYQNQNFFMTNVSTNQEIVDQEYQLYLDAVDQLYVESHPQYLWSTDQDNLLLMPEFQNWHGELSVGNFIWVSFRDNYQVKLRISSITLNPFMIEPNIKIDFTSMVSYRSRRNDYADLLASANSSMKNQISAAITKKVGTKDTINIDTALIMKLINSSAFSGYMSSNNSNLEGSVGNIAAEVIDAAEINVGKIVGTTAQFDELFTEYMRSNIVVTKILNAESADIQNLSAEVITVGRDGITEISNDAIRTATISADQISVTNAFMDYLEANLVVAEAAHITNLSADLAQINTLEASSAFAQYLTSLSSTTAQAVIDDAYIQSAIIGKITAGQLAAGDITLSNAMRIISENGMLVMNGNVMQIGRMITKDGQQVFTGVQIGYNAQDNPSIVITDENGTTMMTSNGITQDAIADDLIVGDMIHDGEISKAKLSFPIVDTDEYGNISITNINDGSGNNFGIEYSNFKQATENSIDTLTSLVTGVELSGQQIFVDAGGTVTPASIPITATVRGNATINKWYIDDVENTTYVSANKKTFTIPSLEMSGKRTIVVKVDTTDGAYDTITIAKVTDGQSGMDSYNIFTNSSNGTIFADGGEITTTTLSCKVYKGTSEITPTSFQWYANGTAVVGATSETYTVNIPVAGNVNNYYCEVEVD